MNRTWVLAGESELNVSTKRSGAVDVTLHGLEQSRRIKQGVSADHALEYFSRVRGHKYYPRDVINQAENFIKEYAL